MNGIRQMLFAAVIYMFTFLCHINNEIVQEMQQKHNYNY